MNELRSASLREPLLLRLFDRVTEAPDAIPRLRQFILDLAVRGKLVEQDADDEAIVGLKLQAISEQQAPFPIPNGWRWATLSSLGRLVGGGTPSKSRNEFWRGDIPWVSPKDMKRDYISNAQLSITQQAVSSSAVNLIDAGSVLFVVRGMILSLSFPVAIARAQLTINQDMKALVLHAPEMAEFVLRALKGLKREILSKVQRSTHGTCRIEGRDYSNLLVPLPPLAEQRRIVAKVDELMALCDRLENELRFSEELRRKLLDAVLHHGLEARIPEKTEIEPSDADS